MNPVFFIGLFAGGVILWLLLSFLYKPIGSVANRLIDDAKRAITEEDKPKQKKKLLWIFSKFFLAWKKHEEYNKL